MIKFSLRGVVMFFFEEGGGGGGGELLPIYCMQYCYIRLHLISFCTMANKFIKPHI